MLQVSVGVGGEQCSWSVAQEIQFTSSSQCSESCQQSVEIMEVRWTIKTSRHHIATSTSEDYLVTLTSDHDDERLGDTNHCQTRKTELILYKQYSSIVVIYKRAFIMWTLIFGVLCHQQSCDSVSWPIANIWKLKRDYPIIYIYH